MKPQNATERNKAFTRFIVFYVITTALIVGAVYFGVQVPFRQNKQLQDQLDVVQKEKEFNYKFSGLMRETKALIDTVNASGPNMAVIETKIAANLIEMEKMINADSISGKRLYTQVWQSLTDAKNDKKLIRSEDKNQLLTDCQQEKAAIEKNLNLYKQQNDEMRQQILLSNMQH